MNARLQTAAGQLQGPIEFLSEEEGKRATVSNRGTLERPWELWKKSALGKQIKPPPDGLRYCTAPERRRRIGWGWL